MIDRRVLVVALIDGELQEMLRKRGNRRIRQRNAIGIHERRDASRMQFNVWSEGEGEQVVCGTLWRRRSVAVSTHVSE